jgi:hypothetical protein
MTVEHAMKCAEADVRIGLAVEPETARVLLDELRRLRDLVEHNELVGGFW